MTLRTRLTLLTFSVLLLTMLAFAGVAGAVLWRVELAAIARQVSAQADALLTVARQAPGPPQGATELLETEGITAVARVYQGSALRWSGGALGPDVLDPTFLTDQESRRTGEVAGYLIASRRAGEVTVQVGRSLTPLRGLLRRYALVAALTLLLLSLLAGALVAREVRRALWPLEALVRRVGQLDTPEPVPAVAERGEVGALARALDTSLGALRAERERETLFLASASHELRTPVTALLADLQYTLARERPPEDLLAALRRTERTAARLRQLTGNLMTLTRAQRLPDVPGPESWPPVDLLDLAGEAVDLLQPLASRRGTDLWLDGQPTPLRGDSALLGSVLENLIGNAIKFTPEGGRVQVQVTPLRGGAGRLVVEDNGPGFPSGTLTEAFVRGQADVEGFGLGLAVVREVVEAHGGTLTLSAAGGGGARAEVVLPA
ncbi:HAMP domain-containing sensor histidine kinase [uncultured Deinococcus sp.]|uniref:sensor histidine kinase n=1 Tax=uncultured Deinococcus sp. TaxID=158789 RepID=UPI00258FD80A|nr:HAMP domain-containing sensor histidine kinase [uncultured Deinococcus sp.]